MKKEDKIDLKIYKKNKKSLIEILAKIVNRDKFSEKELKKVGKIRIELKFSYLEKF